MVYILKLEPTQEYFESFPLFLREMRFADKVLSLRKKRLAVRVL